MMLAADMALSFTPYHYGKWKNRTDPGEFIFLEFEDAINTA